MTEFKVGEYTYTAGKIDAFTQLHIGRRLAPLLSFVTAQSGSFNGIAEALSSASQADVDFIVKNTLKVVKRQSGAAWADVFNAGADRIAFEDIDGLQLLEIVGIALKDAIGPFFSGLVRLVFDTAPLATATSATPTTSSSDQ